MLYTVPTSPVVKFHQPRMGYITEAVTSQQLGRVKSGGSYWKAKFYDAAFMGSIAPGERVMVLGHQGNALLVMPEGYVEPRQQWNWCGLRAMA